MTPGLRAGPGAQAPGPAGRTLDRIVERTPLTGHDGRSGATLERVRLADGTRLVVKRADPTVDLTMRLTGDRLGRELRLWESGVLDGMPAGAGHAVVGGWRDSREVVVVMHDLGDRVLGWSDVVDRALCRRILAAAHLIHRTFAGQRIDALLPLRTRLSMFHPERLRLLGPGSPELVTQALRGWERFAELVPSDVAGAVAAIHRDPAPLVTAMQDRETTLVHGDLWLVNTAPGPDGVVLLDWNLATAAPAAFDVSTFLMGASGVAAAADHIVDDARAAAGSHHDEIALRLALVASLADLGWNKAFDASEGDPATRGRESAALAWWVAQARATLEAGLL